MSFCTRSRGLLSRGVKTLSLCTVAIAAVVLLTGCDNEEEHRMEASQRFFTDTAAQRPSEIAQAYTELQSGQPGQAYATAQGFIDTHPGNPYRPEAYYVAGQALAAQGQFEQGKDRLDVAIDKTHDRNLKALAMLGRADCNMGLGNYNQASRQYHWLEVNYKDVKPLQQDEVMFKLGIAAKKAGNHDWADYWFNQVNELYHSGQYAERARQENSHFNPPPDKNEKPLVYYLEANEFNHIDRAEEAAAALRAKGYRDVEVVASTRNRFPVYEVHVGKFLSRAEAGRAQVDASLAGLSVSVRPGTVEPLK